MAPVLALVALACAPNGSGPSPVVAGPDFFDRPFPSEDRTTTGHPDLSGFPLQEEIPLEAPSCLFLASGFCFQTGVYVSPPRRRRKSQVGGEYRNSSETQSKVPKKGYFRHVMWLRLLAP